MSCFGCVEASKVLAIFPRCFPPLHFTFLCFMLPPSTCLCFPFPASGVGSLSVAARCFPLTAPAAFHPSECCQSFLLFSSFLSHHPYRPDNPYPLCPPLLLLLLLICPILLIFIIILFSVSPSRPYHFYHPYCS